MMNFVIQWYIQFLLTSLFLNFLPCSGEIGCSKHVRIIIPDSDGEQDNNNNPLPSEAAGPSKR